MTKFDKTPGATSFAETAIDQLGTAQDNALMGSLASNFAERRQRREAARMNMLLRQGGFGPTWAKSS